MADESPADAPAGLLRRLAALLYDVLLATALAFAVTFAMLPLTRGEAILSATQGNFAHVYHVLLALFVFAYFGRSWTRRGQTLGMRAWRIRLESAAGTRLGWGASLLRCLMGAGLAWLAGLGAWYLARPGSASSHAAAIVLLAPLVLNHAWILVDGERRSLIDLAGGTRVRRVA